MILSARSGLVLVILSVIGICTHILPHDMGFSTLGVVSMLAAAYLPRSIMLIPVLITATVVDAYNGFYPVLAMSIVYVGHLVAALAVRP